MRKAFALIVLVAAIFGNRAQASSLVVTQRITAPEADRPAHFFGGSIAAHGRWAVTGSTQDREGGDRAGAVYVMRRTAGEWALTQKLLAPDAADEM
ncbi:MAG TPA: hypothetical protein VM841_07965, partial [Actinomycetota bacterium]|nr:hypothetical protein [Actinomycetota bacterium]